MRPLSLFLCMTFFAACGSDLQPSSRVVKPRVLGASLQVVGDEMRSDAYPGETIRFSWLIADSQNREPLSHAIIVCRSDDSRVGITECAEDPFSLDLVATPIQRSQPTIDHEVTIPNGFSGNVTVLATFCVDAPINPSLATQSGDFSEVCQGSDFAPLVANLNFEVLLPGEGNPNKNLQFDSIREKEGMTWNDFDFQRDTQTDCDGSQLPLLRYPDDPDADLVDLEIEIAGRDEVEGRKEEVQLSLYTTHGAISPRFTFLEDEGNVEEFSVVQDEDAQELQTGQVERLFFTARDPRGGFAYAIRDYCLIR